MEQKVWIKTSGPIYPNLYTFIVAHPGVGKSRTIREARRLVKDLPEFHLAPISVTWAALVDRLVGAKRTLMRQPEGTITYNAMFLCADEMGAFISKYDNEMIDGLSALYDPDPYTQERRTNEIKIKIESPQMNILCGSTPQNLLNLMPEKAWGQGFTSRTIMIFSDERILADDFDLGADVDFGDLAHDLGQINTLYGRFEVTKAYQEAVKDWRVLGEPPVPNHPKLIHYVTRRKTHVYKLSMISAIDRGDALVLMEEDFIRALGWLTDAERDMPEIFKAGAVNADGNAMEEIRHFIVINDKGQGVSEAQIIHFAQRFIAIHSILRVVEIMERSGMIRITHTDKKTFQRHFKAVTLT